MTLKPLLAACLIAVALAPPLHAASGSVAAARELYASAAYDEALAMLDALLVDTPTREERQSIALYRILCLVALGRSDDADHAMASLIADAPLYRPSADDLSPRIQAAFTRVRQRMLPAIIQQQYIDAKAAFDRQDFTAATTAFQLVLEALADPDVAAAARQAPLSDLRTLASGFYDLSLKAGTPAPPVPVDPPVAAAPVRDFLRVYSREDPDVVEPGVVRQSIPAFRGIVTTALTGMVEVTISATGVVESAVMRVSIHPQYDRSVVTAAAGWQYKPATLDGVPVKFLRRVQIVLTPAAAPR